MDMFNLIVSQNFEEHKNSNYDKAFILQSDEVFAQKYSDRKSFCENFTI